MSRALRGGPAAVLACLLLGGCGSEGATTFSGDDRVEAGGGGALAYAIPADPGALDPLVAASFASQIVARQVFEPLVSRQDGPFGNTRNEPGLALSWRHSGDFRVWTFQLRSDVRFQDQTPFDAAGVRLNADRWNTSGAGAELLPELIAADAPSPSLVRFILDRPVRDLPARLADPRHGIVSPAALDSNGGASLDAADAGTGPFRLRSRDAAIVVLSRNPEWWGSPLGLGPVLDEVSFRVIADALARVEALRDGEVRVAAGIEPADVALLRDDPLFSAIGSRGRDEAVAFERSVRGLRSAGPESLAPVWVALIEPGG